MYVRKDANIEVNKHSMTVPLLRSCLMSAYLSNKCDLKDFIQLQPGVHMQLLQLDAVAFDSLLGGAIRVLGV